MQLKRVECTWTDELVRAVDAARGDIDRSTYVEGELRKRKPIKQHLPPGPPATRKPRGRPRKPQPPELQ